MVGRNQRVLEQYPGEAGEMVMRAGRGVLGMSCDGEGGTSGSTQ